jgi:hypothetical protein
MMTIIMLGLAWSLLAALVLGLVIFYRWSRGIYKQSKVKAEERKKEELRLWAQRQIASRAEDEETWPRNQEMKMH